MFFMFVPMQRASYGLKISTLRISVSGSRGFETVAGRKKHEADRTACHLVPVLRGCGRCCRRSSSPREFSSTAADLYSRPCDHTVSELPGEHRLGTGQRSQKAL